MNLVISVRTDVLDTTTHHLTGTESPTEVIDDLAYWEASARKQYTGSIDAEASPIGCAMIGPLDEITTVLPEDPVRMR